MVCVIVLIWWLISILGGDDDGWIVILVLCFDRLKIVFDMDIFSVIFGQVCWNVVNIGDSKFDSSVLVVVMCMVFDGCML